MSNRHDLLGDLLVEKALWGLDAAQSAELDRFREAGEDVDGLDLDLAAAALDLALVDLVQPEPMPALLQRHVKAAGEAQIARRDRHDRHDQPDRRARHDRPGSKPDEEGA